MKYKTIVGIYIPIKILKYLKKKTDKICLHFFWIGTTSKERKFKKVKNVYYIIYIYYIAVPNES